MRRDSNVCGICQSPILPHHEANKDHVIPAYHGRLDIQANLRPAHSSCNSSKGRTIPHWSEIRFDLLFEHEVDDFRRLVKKVSWAWGPLWSLPAPLLLFIMGGPPPNLARAPPEPDGFGQQALG